MTTSNLTQTTPTVKWYQRAGVWIGIGINPAMLTVGGGLASRVDLAHLIWLGPLGVFALVSLAVTQGIISRRRREPLSRRAVTTFGAGLGATLLNALMAFGMTGWLGFYLGISGISLANLINLPGWLGALLMAALMLILSNLGLNRWNVLVWITTLAALLVALVAVVAVGETAPPEPITISLNGATIFGVIGSLVAYGILFTLRCGDFTWDLATDADVIKDGLALFVPAIISVGIGALLYTRTGDWNIPDILAQTDLAILGQIFLVIAVIGPMMGSLHSGKLALQVVSGLSEKGSLVLICGLAFVLGATRFDYQLLPMLDLLGAILPPALVISMAWVWLRPSPPVALSAWFLSAMVAAILKWQGQPIHIVVGAVVSLIILLLARYVIKDS